MKKINKPIIKQTKAAFKKKVKKAVDKMFDKWLEESMTIEGMNH